jgi:transcription initiation factor TFIIIB Brf1 subunit/transcription initiation factor TFIIB
MVPWSRPPQPKTAASAAPSASNTMATPTTARSNPFLHLNGPESEPVLFNPCAAVAVSSNPNNNSNSNPNFHEDEEDRCRSCHTISMHTDWRQGDRVCTNCGVVAESRLRDDRPEWKDFAEAEDLVKGLPSQSRSGLVAVDETKYLGGLQPTTLSKHPFGGNTTGGYGLARLRKRLKTTNKRLDYMMEKMHRTALKDAQLDRKIRLKRGDTAVESDSSIRPDLDQVILHEEEDAHRLHAALYAEKWSLDRAILLHGADHEQRDSSSSTDTETEDRKDMLARLDSTLRKAAQDLYTAYSMMTQAAQTLQLPDRVQIEVVHRLVRFVTRRDGFRIPGVSSRLNKNGGGTPQERKEAAEKLKEYNQRKQMASLGAAILFLTARSLGWTRSMVEICASFDNTSSEQNMTSAALIKPKYCARAMKELQSTFPEYARQAATGGGDANNQNHQNNNTQTAANDSVATSNFADHALRRLQLPPVAEASIRTLLVHLRDEQVQLGRNSGTKLVTLCAAVAYLVCSTGSVMQRLAQQHKQSQQTKTTTKKRAFSSGRLSNLTPRKKAKPTDHPTKKIESSDEPQAATDSRQKKDADSSDDDDDLVLGTSSSNDSANVKTDEEPFDVFSHAPIVEDPSEKQEYELRRMWDAWAEQMPWARTAVEVEQSCGVSRNVIADFYKSDLYARRHALLELLVKGVKDDASGNTGRHSLQETPLAPILLAHITTAASLMSSK